jgi:hypothetical protein
MTQKQENDFNIFCDYIFELIEKYGVDSITDNNSHTNSKQGAVN